MNAWRLVVLPLLMSSVLASAQSAQKKDSPNHAPSVVLKAKPESLCEGGTVKLVAEAVDPDGDKLAYRYRNSAGEILGDGRKVRWQLYWSGVHNIGVEVNDGRGGTASATTQVIVYEFCSCPVIDLGGFLDSTGKKPLAVFSVRLSGPPANPTYSWSLSAGKIIRGKGTPKIAVDISGVKTDVLTATLTVGRLAPHCYRFRSAAVKIRE